MRLPCLSIFPIYDDFAYLFDGLKRQLSPRHYVNLGLARVSFAVEEWRDVVSYAREAASDTPSTADQANAWALAALGAFRSGDSQGGYEFLRRAGLTTNDDRVPEASSHTCDK
jgi:hypothetical protein